MKIETQRNIHESERQNRLSNHSALSESSLLRYIFFSSLYMAQGFPSGLMMVAFPAWLAEQGLGTPEIGGFIAIVSIPMSFKFILGPLLDRFGYLPMGRRRPWVLVAQIGFFLSFASISLVSYPASNLNHIIIIGFIVTIFIALQDVAIDGMAIDVIPTNERTRANGFMWGSKTVGIAAGASGGGALLSAKGFGLAVLIVAALIGLITVFPLLLRERRGERLLPWTQGEASDVAVQLQLRDWYSILRGLVRVILLPTSIMTIFAAFFFMLGLGLLRTLLPVLSVQELGWSQTDFSNVFALAGIIACIVGMVLSATILNRLGEIRTLFIITILLMILEIIVGLTIHVWMTRNVFVSFIIIVSVFNFTGTVAILAMFMNMCWRHVAATQFALYMALANLGYSAGAALAGLLDTVFEYSPLFLLMAAGSGLVLILLQCVNMKAHQEHLHTLESESPLTDISN